MKKFISIIMSLLMVVSIIPMSVAMADGETTETPSLYKYQTIFDADTFLDDENNTMKANASATSGDIDKYNVTSTYQSKANIVDGTLSGGSKVLSLVRGGKYDAIGINYADAGLGEIAKNSVGIRFWAAADTETGAATNNLTAGARFTDAEGNHTYVSADGWWGANQLGTLTTEGAYHEIYWATTKLDPSCSFNANHNRLNSASNGNSDTTRVFDTSKLSTMTAFHIVFENAGTAGNTYYIDDIEFIMPYIVKVDGEAYATGTYGETITLPDEEVIGYSDGKTLYVPGSEVTITGDMEFTTIIRSVEDADFDIDVSDKIYTAEKITTTITPLTGLVEDKDYWVYYKDNKEAGTATVVIAGLGNYVGSVEKTFNIVTRTIGEADFSLEQDTYEYTGQAIEPQITTSLESGDYEVAYSNNVNVSDSPVITITGKGNCSGTVTLTFNIAEKALEKEYFTFDLEDKVYTGEKIKPTVASTLGEADYEVSYLDNVNVGVATVTVTGKGNYKGTVEETFNITEKAIADADFTFDLDDKVYTGEEIKPEVTSTLTEADYDITYSNNINVGTATITVTGKGNYNGKVEKTFKITQKSLVKDDFGAIDDQTYANAKLEPAINVVNQYVTSQDYEVEYSENENVGTATAVITGKGNFKGEVKLTFEIVKKTLVKEDFTVDESAKEYTGSGIETAVSSTLKEGDYQVSYESNVNVGTATVIITGVTNCKGEVRVNFNIYEKEISEDDFEIDFADKEYTGNEIKPRITTTLNVNDYEYEYINNVNAGTATILIKGKRNYKGEFSKTFNITAQPIEESDFTFDLVEKTYTGEEIKPEATSTLTEADYDITYSNNINVGTATITVTGKGNFKGTISKSFYIGQKSLEATDFTVDTAAVTYTGAEQIKEIVTSLVLDTDYTVTYSNNINVGIASIVIEGIGNYKDQVTVNFDITTKAINEAMFSVNTASVYYTGKANVKSITSGLKAGIDYTVAYSNNVNVGTATITITGKGNFSGTVIKTFTIVKPKVNNVKKVTVKASGKKKATVSWKKVKGATGYVITYSMNKKFKKAKKHGTKTIYVKKASTVKKVIKKLKSGKKYYVKVAAYKNYKNSAGKTVKAIGKYTKAKKAVKIK